MRECAWCRGPIPPTMRVDAACCSVRCRQARHRFKVGVGRPGAVADGHTLRLAYADPPYPGKSRKYYGNHPDFAGEVDHPALIASLTEYDGWALSTSASALPEVLASCPPGVRVAAWHRGERPTRSLGPLNAWEPVIYRGGRLSVVLAGEHDASRSAVVHASRSTVVTPLNDREASRGSGRRVDSLIYTARARRTDPAWVTGAKPAAFSRWIFDLLGALPGDEFTDVFPGSGGVLRAWEAYCSAEADASQPHEL